ncbi:MAG TPA: hypothetical protein VNA25_28010 [Phycisphaerae bacterium]|nr:hypothetical protein [Phycisphaerae bacterium]
MPDTATTTAPAPLLVDAREAARLCGVSRASWWGYNAAGRVPSPIHLCGRTLWRRDELAAWIEAGCPARERWKALRATGKWTRGGA